MTEQANGAAGLAPRPLDGLRAIVTGGATGVGLGITRRLLEAGAEVTVAGRRGEVLEDAAARLRAEIAGAVVRCARCDIAVSAEVDAAVAVAAADAGLDIAVANAGGVGITLGPFLQLGEDAWRAACELNIVGTANTLRAAAWAMRGRGGSIVAISSAASVAPEVSNSHYSATRAAVDMMVKNAAQELGRFGIRVNSLLPGLTASEATVGDHFPEELTADLVTRTPLGRRAVPEEIGDTVVHLAGPGGAFVTGQVIAVDGGMTVQPMGDLTLMARKAIGDDLVDEAFGRAAPSP